MSWVGSLRARYRSEDAEFLRREVARTRVWLTRGGGAGWLAIYGALLVVQSLLVVTVRPNSTGYGSLGSVLWTSLQFGWVFSVPAWFALAGWATALQTRTFGPLTGERGGQLFLTKLEGRHLWPALLTGPLALRMAMAVAAALAGLATFTYWIYREGPPDDGPAPAVWLIFRIYSMLLGLALSGAQHAAATAWAAWWIHPGGPPARTGIRAALVSVGCFQLDTLMILLSQAAMLGGFDRYFSPALRDPRLLLPYQHAFLPGVMLRLLVFAALTWIAVRRLRSPSAMEAWRRGLEA